MIRVKLLMPEHKIFSTEIAVRITDINYGNHVGNDAFVRFIHEARVQWLAKENYTELNIEGASLIMADLAVEYKGESFYGDILKIDIAVGEISRAGFELYYQIHVNRHEHRILIAKAKTGMVCYNYIEKKVSALPEKFSALLQSTN
ncbi:MAG: acyl-CoA thioesterase [Ferruginibacter sp.]